MTLQELRKRAGLTQHEVAETLNIRQHAISQWETGKTYPQTSVLLQLAKIYDCSVEDILKADAETQKTG